MIHRTNEKECNKNNPKNPFKITLIRGLVGTLRI